MELAKKNFTFVLTALAILLVVNTAIATILPESSYVDRKVSYYDGDASGRRVVSAVYDKELAASEGELELTGGISTRYLYAYQIYKGDITGYQDIDAFSILGIGAHETDPIVTSEQDSLTDPEEDPLQELSTGVAAIDQYYGTGYASWLFGGEGSVIAEGQHSVWLFVQSNNPMTYGTYEFKGGINDTTVVPDQDLDSTPAANFSQVPEPITITLLGLGGLILRKTGKKTR